MRDRNDSEIRRQRKKQKDKQWEENPKQEFFETRKESITQENYQREKYRIERFESFINQHEKIPDEVGIADVVEEDVHRYLSENLAPDENLNDKTVEEHLTDLNYFYKTLRAHNVLDDNPVYKPNRESGDRGALAYVREADEFDTSKNAKRPYVPMERMQAFLDWIDSAKIRSLHLTGLKAAARSGSVVNLDLRCVHIAHPLYYQLLDEHNVKLDQRVKDRPDSLLIYEGFSRGTEIPNENRPGPNQGEIRKGPCKRMEDKGSVIPIDSELKTALLEYALVRPRTTSRNIHPFFTADSVQGRRMDYESFNYLWCKVMPDSIRKWGREEALSECPSCGGPVTEQNPEEINPGRHYDCQKCGERHWRSIMWESGLETPQKYVFHCHRNFFSDAHRRGKSDITDNEMDEIVRKYKIRGDSRESTDADQKHYDNPENLDWEKDVRQPYLDAIYKFNIFDNPVPAVGEGWNYD